MEYCAITHNSYLKTYRPMSIEQTWEDAGNIRILKEEESMEKNHNVMLRERKSQVVWWFTDKLLKPSILYGKF